MTMTDLEKTCHELIDFNIECEICEIFEEEWHEELFDYLEFFYFVEEKHFTLSNYKLLKD